MFGVSNNLYHETCRQNCKNSKIVAKLYLPQLTTVCSCEISPLFKLVCCFVCERIVMFVCVYCECNTTVNSVRF